MPVKRTVSALDVGSAPSTTGSMPLMAPAPIQSCPDHRTV